MTAVRMKLKCALPAVLSLVLWANSAHAEFYGKYSDWRSLSVHDRALYAAGLVDGITVADTTDNYALYYGIVDCFKALEMTPDMVQQAITTYYEQHTSDWGVQPSVIFAKAIERGMCLKYVNAQRKKKGFPALPPS